MRDTVSITVPPSEGPRPPGWGAGAGALLLAGIFFGSRGFKDFDPALVPYAGASVFSAFGIGYRYSMWLRRPPTRLYWQRGWQLFFHPKHLPGNLLHQIGRASCRER